MKLTAGFLFCFAISIAAQIHDEFGSAIDARGVRYVGKSSGTPAPWLADALFRPKPDYPYNERHLHHEGIAVFRMDIDLKTGTTTNVSMIQSSGFPKLDDVALNCVRRWRWRPGQWKQVEMCQLYSRCRRCGQVNRFTAVDRRPPNQTMKPTALLRNEFEVCATTLCRGLSLSR